jgi:hypothetical protein
MSALELLFALLLVCMLAATAGVGALVWRLVRNSEGQAALFERDVADLRSRLERGGVSQETQASELRERLSQTQSVVEGMRSALSARQAVEDDARASLRRLESVIAGSSTRGAAGENILEEVLQHLPSEMERLVKPVLDDEVDVAHGSRVLGDADPNSRSRELGIVFFNKLVSLITRTKVSDCSNGYRAVRTTVLPQLVLRQEQFHTSEFLIEAIKHGIPAKEVPVTVAKRTHGHSKKPAVMRYGLGFANAIVRTWLR